MTMQKLGCFGHPATLRWLGIHHVRRKGLGGQTAGPGFHNCGRTRRLKNCTSGVKWRLCCWTPSRGNPRKCTGEAVWGASVYSGRKPGDVLEEETEQVPRGSELTVLNSARLAAHLDFTHWSLAHWSSVWPASWNTWIRNRGGGDTLPVHVPCAGFWPEHGTEVILTFKLMMGTLRHQLLSNVTCALESGCSVGPCLGQLLPGITGCAVRQSGNKAWCRH